MPSAPCSAVIGDVERRGVGSGPRALRRCERIFSRSSLVRIGWRTSSRLCFEVPSRSKQVRPRPDEGDQAHHQFLADRVDRRVGHLREVLLEIGVEQLGLVGQRRDRRVVAHRAHRFLAGRGHRRHQELEVFLRVAEGLLAVEQRHVGARRARSRPRAGPPARSGCASATPCRDARCASCCLDLLVGDDAALLEVDQQHLAGLQAPLGDDVLLGESAARPSRRP